MEGAKGLFRYLLCAVAIVSLAALPAVAQPGRRVDDAALRNVGKTGQEWLSYGLDLSETRYSPLKQIDTTNVNRLGLAWSYDVGSGGSGQQATPLVSNGIIYGITNWSITFAVDARTGKELWRWDPKVDRDATRPKICCGIVNRGIALYQDKVYVPVIDGRLAALDSKTGKVVWQSQVSSVADNYTLTMAPRIAKGKVIIGVAGGEFPTRGYFDAYDAMSGKRLWRFYTVPGDPSKPFENDALKRASATWSGDFWKMGGGGSVWDAISYDPDADLIYVGTGNAGPYPEALRYSKGQDNQYVCSIVAVKSDTGKLKWYFQSVPGDSWDYDANQQMTLTDLTINGRKRKVLIQAQKNGFFYVLDRITGEFISAAPFTTVNWAKGIDPKTGRPLINPEARYSDGPSVVSPGPGGGHNWAAMAFNPSTGLVYIPSTIFSSWTFVQDPNFVYKPGSMNMGIAVGAPAAAPAAPKVEPEPAQKKTPEMGPDEEPFEDLPPPPAAKATRPSAPPIGPVLKPGESTSALVAWDPVAQKERWRTPGGGSYGGGCLTTAGNLVFQVMPNGRLVVYSADKGEKLLDVRTGLKGGMGAPMTYEIDGKQYVSLMGGQGKMERYGDSAGSQKPLPSLAPPKLLTFVLDGKAPLPK